MNNFPSHLADTVIERWENLVDGNYVAPPCPPKALLKELLETCHLVACAPEEGRYLGFNIVASPKNFSLASRPVPVNEWKLSSPRRFDFDQLRRLAPATDIKKSAIHVEWSQNQLRIVGLLDLGTSWFRARIGLEYKYPFLSSLLINVESPSRMRVFQKNYRIAELHNGAIVGAESVPIPLFLHEPVGTALETLIPEIAPPHVEPAQDYEGFAFTALWNCFAAIANSISDAKHGGALVIVPTTESAPSAFLDFKYRAESSVLRSAYIDFMEKRNLNVDLICRSEKSEPISKPNLHEHDFILSEAHSTLVEALRFVSRLSGCDGAIVLSRDLRLLGFGCEIKADLHPETKVVEATDSFHCKEGYLDVEQFGMRHRSAIKLASQNADYVCMVISQDGPVTAIWNKDDNVWVQKGVKLVNLNMLLG